MTRLDTLPKICVALAAKRPEELIQLAHSAIKRNEAFLELRLDMLEDPEQGVGALERIAHGAPHAVLLVTCRRRVNHGEFEGSIDEQLAILDRAIKAGAKLVDVEIETAEERPEWVAGARAKARLVVSFHDFEKTPALKPILGRLRKVPADIYKIATMAVKPSDNLRLISLLEAEGPLVTLAMGELGAAARILAPARGAAFTFAAPDTAPGTAPGQFTASAMRNLYQAHRHKSSTKLYGVIADPVAHSLSPLLHNRAFRRKRLDACYLPFRVAPNQLTDFFKLVEELPLEGFSVTIPHKQAVMKRLDRIEPLAARIGAVNTVFRTNRGLIGANSDAIGVTAPLEKRISLKGAQILVAGSGGAARAAAFALADKGAKVTITGRTAAKVHRLARDSGAAAVLLDDLGRRHYQALINATSVGMYPNVNESLFSDSIPADLVFDMVYNPLETALLRQAKEMDKECIEGIEMFLEQAIAQFEMWTGVKAPRVTMRNAVLEVLTGAAR